MTREEALSYRNKVVDGEKVAEMGGFNISIKQSDKLGFDWKVTSINGIEVVKEYAEQENPLGTSAGNPIIYTEDTPLINNAFYNVDGVIKVWMGEWVNWQII